MSNAHAVVVLPPGAYGQIADHRLRRWISRGRLDFAAPDADALHQVLQILRVPQPETGYAALRYWGQTGVRPAVWMAAADPVHLETRLRHLVLRAFRPGEIAADELGAIFRELQATLGNGDDTAFEAISNSGYLTSQAGFATATVSATVADGRLPDEFTPGGEQARRLHQLQSEVQMLLHGMEINQIRVAGGQVAVNALWFWGGGSLPEPRQLSLPMLFADDPLFKGFWHNAGARTAAWDADIRRAVGNAGGAVVMVAPPCAPERSADLLRDCLDAFRRCLWRGDLEAITALFGDGLSVRLRRRDLLRFWRGASRLLNERDAGA